ncbi:hypothetical protein WA1_05835 [Scytonema hofmannii PCC 7110]|uniref:Uncharacterized protein n=1 Tax=Scytonema hofmannii PCC 7110 TaxID=128403 RepID=A0A139WTN8_9CYAN|nr:hypothetical protein [Scytonema hofmannii]KYC35815.1 hypothetical protein WA1_05835 [Scytonema hofmannii PCC 7110]
MSNTINNSRDLLPSNIEEIRLGDTEKKLQHSPFLIAWSKINAFFKRERVESEVESQQESQATIDYADSTKEQYSYTRFTDRVDPSVYYTIFFSQKRLDSDQ